MKRVLGLFLVASAVLAQDAGEQERTPTALLTDAILHFRQQAEIVVQAEIKHEKPKGDAGGGGAGGFGGQVIVRVAGPGGPVAPFSGQVEAWRDRHGVTVILSQEALPGFGLYVGKQRTITQMTYEEERPTLRQIEAELVSLLETERFVQHVLDAHKAGKLEATVHEDGDITFKGPIAREIVRPVGNAVNLGGIMVAGGMPGSRVLRAEGTFVVTRDGTFRSVAVKLTRSDPLGGLGTRVRIIGPGGVPVPPDGAKRAEKHDVEGGSTTYTLKLGTNQPSERALLFKRSMRQMLAK